jgi:uncharacterized membrane protein
MAKEIISNCGSFSELSRISWHSLKGKRLLALGTILVLILLQSAVSFIPYIGNFSGLLLAPLSAGVALFQLKLVRKEETDFWQIFDPFNQYFRFVWASIRIFIFILLWGLLLIIPGIIASYRYAMTILVMLDHPDYTVKEAMAESSAIMYGHKMQFFGYILLLSLIVCTGVLLTLGIGAFWLLPWTGTFIAAFYDSIRRKPEVSPENVAPPQNLRS